MVFCSNCGTRGEGRYCYRCGSALHADPGATPDAAGTGAPPAVVATPVTAVAVPHPAASAAPDTWSGETRRAWTWWKRGFLWLTVIVTIELLVFVSGPGADGPRTGGEVVASTIGGLIGLGVVLGIQYALARWLLSSFERGSGIARRVFQIGFVGLGAVRTISAFAMFGSFLAFMDLVCGLGQLAAWGYAAWLLEKVSHESTPRSIVREDGTVVRMRTEVPSFVATLAILLLGVVQFGADLVRGR